MFRGICCTLLLTFAIPAFPADLHDTLIVFLAVMNTLLWMNIRRRKAAERLDIWKREAAQKALRESQQLLTKAFASLRDRLLIVTESRMVADCNPAAVALFGYSREELVGRSVRLLHVDSSKSIGADRHSRCQSARHPAEESMVFLFSAVRELLVNVAKHAAASEAVVRLRWRDDGVEVLVADNGKGFERAGPSDFSGPRAGIPDGIGLFNIQERVSDLGGRVSLRTAPGRGTAGGGTLRSSGT